MQSKRVRQILILGLIAALSCVEPFSPPSVTGVNSHIVIDGFLDTKLDTLTVKVYRTVQLDDPDQPVPVSTARVTLETSMGEQFEVPYQSEGVYQLGGITVSPAASYRISVEQAGHTYRSDFVTPQETPPIDSLTYNYDAENLYIYLFAHAQNGTPQYFRWNFTETWAYHARFQSNFDVVDHQVVPRTNDIYHCWMIRGIERN